MKPLKRKGQVLIFYAVFVSFVCFRNNQLSDLPSEMQNLTKLRSIILVYNR